MSGDGRLFTVMGNQWALATAELQNCLLLADVYVYTEMVFDSLRVTLLLKGHLRSLLVYS